ncbi:1,6-anhydro-N-acetylmuramyl-L-alanine amidase AmpD [Mycoavidus sp. HKI]|uniref:1,6-anhydro-N-acetylmuramyl-L-alanine amidase AmpD n=1 Tax=Mycoavidus sp. HKI TaxID=2840467 RepID=UPI001CBCC7B9|nr:1,6-anhydro-N-acetylmuramyl-L-alanine amidase AmpD [Mycoavidus sp. HKI]UAW64529.1 1,6-anhydro-N-acetylmuramyl-L-alanine amidase AmpD [Mycoavidus sp. HKI]
MRLMIDESGWIEAVSPQKSPNFNARPIGITPTLIVIHNISLPPGEFGGPQVAEFFCNRLDFDAHSYYGEIRRLQVSAHFLIRRNGDLQQFVSCDDRAWHAGASNFFGREGCNDFSIGIELEGVDTVPFEATQYLKLAELIKALMDRYPIGALVGHEDIAPGRKTDPGPHFDWQRLRVLSGLAEVYFPYQGPNGRELMHERCREC